MSDRSVADRAPIELGAASHLDISPENADSNADSGGTIRPGRAGLVRLAEFMRQNGRPSWPDSEERLGSPFAQPPAFAQLVSSDPMKNWERGHAANESDSWPTHSQLHFRRLRNVRDAVPLEDIAVAVVISALTAGTLLGGIYGLFFLLETYAAGTLVTFLTSQVAKWLIGAVATVSTLAALAIGPSVIFAVTQIGDGLGIAWNAGEDPKKLDEKLAEARRKIKLGCTMLADIAGARFLLGSKGVASQSGKTEVSVGPEASGQVVELTGSAPLGSQLTGSIQDPPGGALTPLVPAPGVDPSTTGAGNIAKAMSWMKNWLADPGSGDLEIPPGTPTPAGGSFGTRRPEGSSDSGPHFEALAPFRGLTKAERETIRVITDSFHPPLTEGHWRTIDEHFLRSVKSEISSNYTFLLQALAAIHIERATVHFRALSPTISVIQIDNLQVLSQLLRSPIMEVWSADVGRASKLIAHLPSDSLESKQLLDQQLKWSITSAWFKQFENKIKHYFDARLQSAALNEALSDKFQGELIGIRQVVSSLPPSELQQKLLELIDIPDANLGLFFHQGFNTGRSVPESAAEPRAREPRATSSVPHGPPSPILFHDGTIVQVGQQVTQRHAHSSNWVDRLFSLPGRGAEIPSNNRIHPSGEIRYQFIRQVEDRALLRSMDGEKWLLLSRQEFATTFESARGVPAPRSPLPVPSLLDIPPMPREEIIAVAPRPESGPLPSHPVAVYRVVDNNGLNYRLQNLLDNSEQRTISFGELRDFSRWQVPQNLQNRFRKMVRNANDADRFYRDVMHSDHLEAINRARAHLLEEGAESEIEADLKELRLRILQSSLRSKFSLTDRSSLQREEEWRNQLRELGSALAMRLQSQQQEVGVPQPSAERNELTQMTKNIWRNIHNNTPLIKLQEFQRQVLEEKPRVVGDAIHYTHTHPQERSPTSRELDRLGDALRALTDKIHYLDTRKPLTLSQLKTKIPETLTAHVQGMELPVTQLDITAAGPHYVVAGGNAYRLEEVKGLSAESLSGKVLVYEVWVRSHTE